MRTYLAASWNVEVQRTCSKRNGGRISPDKELCYTGARTQAGLFISSSLYLPFLCSFLLLPMNLHLGLSHGDANQTRNGVQPAVVATAAGVGLCIQRAGYLPHEQQGHGRGHQRMRPQCPALHNAECGQISSLQRYFVNG